MKRSRLGDVIASTVRATWVVVLALAVLVAGLAVLEGLTLTAVASGTIAAGALAWLWPGETS